jgi:hypothetical protein
MTAAVFAARHHVGRASLYSWATKLHLRETRAASTSFVAVDVVGDDRAAPVYDACMELVTRSGRIIRMSSRVDSEALARVLEVAERC